MLTFLALMFYERGSESESFFSFRELEQIPGFVHAITSRRNDLPRTPNDALETRQVAAGKNRLLNVLGLAVDELCQLRQIHSTKIFVGSDSSKGGGNDLPQADGILLLEAGRYGVIRTADCLSLLLVSPETRTCCVLHAGWRGTRNHIARQGVEALVKASRTSADSIVAAMGPCIRACCYAVGPEVQREFEQTGHAIEKVFKGTHLDLIEANRADLEGSGITRILDSGLCTSCRTDLFYSHRALKDSGRMWTVVGFRPVAGVR